MQTYLLAVPISGTLPSPHSSCHIRLAPRTARLSASPLLCRQHNTAVALRKRSRVLISSALGGSPEGSSSSDNDDCRQGYPGDGVGPEGIAEDPVLHDLIMGTGSSGTTGGQKPTGAPGTNVA